MEFRVSQANLAAEYYEKLCKNQALQEEESCRRYSKKRMLSFDMNCFPEDEKDQEAKKDMEKSNTLQDAYEPEAKPLKVVRKHLRKMLRNSASSTHEEIKVPKLESALSEELFRAEDHKVEDDADNLSDDEYGDETDLDCGSGRLRIARPMTTLCFSSEADVSTSFFGNCSTPQTLKVTRKSILSRILYDVRKTILRKESSTSLPPPAAPAASASPAVLAPAETLPPIVVLPPLMDPDAKINESNNSSDPPNIDTEHVPNNLTTRVYTKSGVEAKQNHLAAIALRGRLANLRGQNQSSSSNPFATVHSTIHEKEVVSAMGSEALLKLQPSTSMDIISIGSETDRSSSFTMLNNGASVVTYTNMSIDICDIVEGPTAQGNIDEASEVASPATLSALTDLAIAPVAGNLPSSHPTPLSIRSRPLPAIPIDVISTDTPLRVEVEEVNPKKTWRRPQLTLDEDTRTNCFGGKSNSGCEIIGNNISDNIFNELKPVSNLSMDAFRVRFLGTGCAAPSPQRSNSAILVTLLAPPPPSSLQISDTSLRNVRESKRLKRGPTFRSSGEYQSHLPFSAFSDNDEEEHPKVTIAAKESNEPSVPLSQPSNTSSCSENGPSILLDCGEGAASQLFQLCGGDVSRFDTLLLSLRMIWISHHHADHASGVSMLLHHIRRAQMRRRRSMRVRSLRTALTRLVRAYPAQQWDKYRIRDGLSSPQFEPGKILLMASETVLRATEFCLSVAGLDDLVSFLPITNSLYAGLGSEAQAATDGRLAKLISIPVQHCHSAFALVLEHSLGHRLVFSGDCRPSLSLVRAGRDCQLLIHEATFDDCDAEEARKKKHSTVHEALQVGAQMRAKLVALTHFSQRYNVRRNKNLQVLDPPMSGGHSVRETSVLTDQLHPFLNNARRTRISPFSSSAHFSSPHSESNNSPQLEQTYSTQQYSRESGRLLFAKDFTSFRCPSQFAEAGIAHLNAFNGN